MFVNGAALGLSPETMIALALIKRARQLFYGVPVLVAGELMGLGIIAPIPVASLPSATVTSQDQA
jgi:hypothetical protein